MHVISRKRLLRFAADHPDAKDAPELLDNWYRLAKRAEWAKFADVKAVSKTADVVGKYTVINIGGNKYRIILEIIYEKSRVLIRHVLTHAEYDKNLWRAGAFTPAPRKPRPPRQADEPKKRDKPRK